MHGQTLTLPYLSVLMKPLTELSAYNDSMSPMCRKLLALISAMVTENPQSWLGYDINCKLQQNTLHVDDTLYNFVNPFDTQ